MKIQPFSPKFHRAVSASLAASLILVSSVQAQSNYEPEPNVGCTDCSTKVSPIQAPLGPSISGVTGSVNESVPTATALRALIQELQAGNTTLTDFQSRLTAAGVNPDTSNQAAVVTGSLSETQVRAILARIRNRSSLPIPSSITDVASSTNEVLIASSQLDTMAQSSTSPEANAAVSGLYNTFNQAFISGGINPTEADRNAANLVIALSSVKGTLRKNGYINLKEVNRLVSFVNPSIAILPRLVEAAGNNASLQTFQRIQDTVSALEVVALYITAINNSV